MILVIVMDVYGNVFETHECPDSARVARVVQDILDSHMPIAWRIVIRPPLPPNQGVKDASP